MTTTAYDSVISEVKPRIEAEHVITVAGLMGLFLGLVNLIVTGLMSWLHLANNVSLPLYGGLYGLTAIVLIVVQLSFFGIYLRNDERWGIPETLFTLCLLASIALAGWTMLGAFAGQFYWGVSILHLVLCVLGLGLFFGLKDNYINGDAPGNYDYDRELDL